MYFDQLSRDVVLSAPLQVAPRPVGCFGAAVVDLAVALDRAVEDLVCPVYMQHQVLGGIPGVHQYNPERQLPGVSA